MNKRPNSFSRVAGSQKTGLIVGVATVVIVALILAAFAMRGRSSDEVIIYSGRSENFVEPVLRDFERETGIRVRLLSGNATSFAHRIVEERSRPQADIFLANDAGVMEFLRLQGVLTPITSPGIERIPTELRADDNAWTGLSVRARIFMYNKDLIDEAGMPQSIFDISDPRYRGRFAVTRAGNASLISHIAALRAAHGDEKVRELIGGMLANEPVITSGHTDIRRMVGAGEVEFGLVNCYYFRQQLAEQRNNNVGAVYPDQGEGQAGAFVNVAGAARIKDSPNPDNAAKLLEFLLETDQLQSFVELSLETPILPELEATEGGLSISEFKSMDMPLSNIGPVWEDTLEAMEAAGFAE